MSRDKTGLDALELPGASRLPAAPACPFCERTQTELLNAFGAHASVSSYWCRDCRSPFELLKWGGRR
jgi:transposase-like protein